MGAAAGGGGGGGGGGRRNQECISCVLPRIGVNQRDRIAIPPAENWPKNETIEVHSRWFLSLFPIQ